MVTPYLGSLCGNLPDPDGQGLGPRSSLQILNGSVTGLADVARGVVEGDSDSLRCGAPFVLLYATPCVELISRWFSHGVCVTIRAVRQVSGDCGWLSLGTTATTRSLRVSWSSHSPPLTGDPSEQSYRFLNSMMFHGEQPAHATTTHSSA